MGIQVLETDVCGPLPKDTVGLLLGRSSSTLRGLIVFPGVVDSDYQGTLKVLCHSPYGVVSIAPRDRIAQLLLMPSLHSSFPARDESRQQACLGSSGVDVACLSMQLDNRPMLDIIIEGKNFSGLIDTGADRSIIKQDAWPRAWPLQNSSQTLQGLGYANCPQLSAKELYWKTEEGQQGRFQPYVLQIPVNLWGRDIQTQMQLRLTNEYSKTSQTMLKIQGFVPEKGLGKHLQGRTEPILPTCKNDRKGLGFT